MNLFGVPWKVLAIVAGVFGVGLILYSTIGYIQEAEEDKIILELKEQSDSVRKEIRDELKANEPTDRNDATDSLRYFEDRN